MSEYSILPVAGETAVANPAARAGLLLATSSSGANFDNLIESTLLLSINSPAA
jgi:hypothetical protein